MPQTVPNRPTNGAVEPTEASTAMPDCSWVVNSSMAWRRLRVTQSLMSSVSRKALWVPWWCAVASRPASTSWRNGLDGSSPRAFKPADRSGLSQKASAWRAILRKRSRSRVLMRMTVQEASDISSSSTATDLMMMSPWLQTLARPNWAFMNSLLHGFQRITRAPM